MAVVNSSRFSSICLEGLMKMTNLRISCPLTPTFETSTTETHIYSVTDTPASSVSATGGGPEKNTEPKHIFTASPTHQRLQCRQREEGLRKTLKHQGWQPLWKSPVTNIWQIFALGLTKWGWQERWSLRIDRSVQHLLSLPDLFAKLRKATTSFVITVHPSVCPPGITRRPLDGFSWNLTFEYISKICPEYSGLIKNWQEWRVISLRPEYIYDNISLTSS